MFFTWWTGPCTSWAWFSIESPSNYSYIALMPQQFIKVFISFETFLQVAQRYEILLIQEIRDKTQTSFPKLVKRLNDISQHQYNFVQSQRLGRTKSKEQYGYIYKYGFEKQSNITLQYASTLEAGSETSNF